MPEPSWIDVGSAEELAKRPLQQIVAGKMRLALSFKNGEFGAISGNCNHVGGPLGEGTHDANCFVTCPWHGWKFHWRTGFGEPGFEDDRVPDVRRQGRRRPRAGQPGRAHDPQPAAPRAASAGAEAGAGRRDRSASSASRRP